MCLHTRNFWGVRFVFISLCKSTPFLGAIPPPPSAGLGAWRDSSPAHRSPSGPERGGCRHWALAAGRWLLCSLFPSAGGSESV